MAESKCGLSELEILTLLRNRVNKYLTVVNLRPVMNVNREIMYHNHHIKHLSKLYTAHYNSKPVLYIDEIKFPEFCDYKLQDSKLTKIIQFEETRQNGG